MLPGRRGPVEWTVTGRTIALDVELAAEPGRVLPELGAGVRQAVAAHVTAMTGLEVRVVDVTVTSLARERERR